jgi:hypothetical protein
MLLARALDARLWTAPRAWELAFANLVALAAFSLAQTLGIYGYALKRLIEAIGPVRAVTLLAIVAAIAVGLKPDAGGIPAIRVLVTLIGVILLCLCWIRTHALWLLWGAHFAWAAVTAVVFGLPLGGSIAWNSVVETRAIGALWLTGGDFGPAAALLTAPILLAAIYIVIRITSDYAWNYTRKPIHPAGIEVNMAPPAAHAAMEAEAPRPTLVQILPPTPDPNPYLPPRS